VAALSLVSLPSVALQGCFRVLTSRSGLITGTTYLSTTVDTSFAFDRPLHTVGIVLLFSGLTIIAYDAWTAAHRPLAGRSQYNLIDLDVDEGIGRPLARDSSPTGPISARPRELESRKRLIAACVLLFTLCCRIAVYWRVQTHIECTSPSALVGKPWTFRCRLLFFADLIRPFFPCSLHSTIAS
jgi:hypothetical protein